MITIPHGLLLILLVICFSWVPCQLYPIVREDIPTTNYDGIADRSPTGVGKHGTANVWVVSYGFVNNKQQQITMDNH